MKICSTLKLVGNDGKANFTSFLFWTALMRVILAFDIYALALVTLTFGFLALESYQENVTQQTGSEAERTNELRLTELEGKVSQLSLSKVIRSNNYGP